MVSCFPMFPMARFAGQIGVWLVVVFAPLVGATGWGVRCCAPNGTMAAPGDHCCRQTVVCRCCASRLETVDSRGSCCRKAAWRRSEKPTNDQVCRCGHEQVPADLPPISLKVRVLVFLVLLESAPAPACERAEASAHCERGRVAGPISAAELCARYCTFQC